MRRSILKFTLPTLTLLAFVLTGNAMTAKRPAAKKEPPPAAPFEWKLASPESQGISSESLETVWEGLRSRDTTAFAVVRNDRLIFERYAQGYDREKPHGAASLSKAMVGGISLILEMGDGRVRPGDPVSKYVRQWSKDAKKRAITLRHLATHTSGLEDAEADGLPHDRLSGWKGDFWKRLPPPDDPFTLARDVAPLLEGPGERERYSNPCMAMLSYALTAALKGSPQDNLRDLLRERVMAPLGVPNSQWSVGYGETVSVGGLKLVASWGGGSYSPDAAARVGRLLLHHGEWEGKRLLSPESVKAATAPSGLPGHSGLGFWTNRNADGSRFWKSAPRDAFWGAGAGHQLLLVVPSMNLIVVRQGGNLDPKRSFDEGLERCLVDPLMEALKSRASLPPKSPVIREIVWAPKASIRRAAEDSDNWPITWGDDDKLYTAYGDGYGFEPKAPEKLSLGLATVSGSPEDFRGENLRSETAERKGNGPNGPKASGLLMVGGTLYMWVRNVENSQLAWSEDRGRTWTWSPWKLTSGFGCPTFLNYGRDYDGARDDYVYVYSPDSEDAYAPADRMALAKVPKDRIRDRAAYEFFVRLDRSGKPVWTKEIGERGAVFENPGRCYRSGVSYDAGIRRYLWAQIYPGGDPRFSGGFGVFDAPEPWGPWTIAGSTERWDVGPGETASFPAKWISPDGETLYLVFSGDDHFSVRQATLRLR
jgi:CubicO group peptidase (beta-lactamase class C family)